MVDSIRKIARKNMEMGYYDESFPSSSRKLTNLIVILNMTEMKTFYVGMEQFLKISVKQSTGEIFKTPKLHT